MGASIVLRLIWSPNWPEVKTGLLLTQKNPLLNQGKTVFFTPKLQFLKKVCNLGVKTAIFFPENLPIYRYF
jgi:hypothetical protein